MPTLTDLRRDTVSHAQPGQPTIGGEELIADTRASLRPSQLVERKLQARSLSDFGRRPAESFRPRAK
jgi:hypothetical protein